MCPTWQDAYRRILKALFHVCVTLPSFSKVLQLVCLALSVLWHCALKHSYLAYNMSLSEFFTKLFAKDQPVKPAEFIAGVVRCLNDETVEASAYH